MAAASPSRNKRPREEGAGREHGEDAASQAASLRMSLLRRLDATPAYWADIAARLGTIGADAGLCALGREVADFLRTVEESAESSRQRLEALRGTLHAAIDMHIDELLVKLSVAESAKAAALERELELLDTTLERTRREYAAVRESAAACDDELAARSADLTARLDDIDALLVTLPHGPIEPSLLQVDLDQDAVLAVIRGASTVIAPRGVQATDVVVRGLPAHVRLGRPFQFELALSDDYPCRSPAELETAAKSLAFHARVNAHFVHGAEQMPLHVELAASDDPNKRGCVVAAAVVPGSGRAGDSVVVRSISLFGRDLSCGLMLPRSLAVLTGMDAPLALDCAGALPIAAAISHEGVLYVKCSDSLEMSVFAANGSALPPLQLAPFGLTSRTSDAAFIADSGTLLLADENEDGAKVVAVDPKNMRILWSVNVEEGSSSLAILPAQGVALRSSYSSRMLFVHSLSDGSCISSLEADFPTYATSDVASATFYVGTFGGCISAFRWNGSALVAEGDESEYGSDHHPLAVVPAAAGHRTSYLVVGTLSSGMLHILSLPDRRLVHTHTCEGIHVSCLAADPSGTALAVCDEASKSLHVLPWPLPGMPLL
jgi:hypothetical protein